MKTEIKPRPPLPPFTEETARQKVQAADVRLRQAEKPQSGRVVLEVSRISVNAREEDATVTIEFVQPAADFNKNS